MLRSSGSLVRAASALFIAAVLVSGTVAPESAEASTTGTMTGVVTYADTGLPAGAGEVEVGALTGSQLGPTVTVLTDAEGRYSLTLPQGSWKLRFDYLPSGQYADEWSTNAPSKLVSTSLWVPQGGVLTFDAQLERGAGLSGTLLLPDGSPATNGSVTIERFYDFQNYPWHAISYSVDTDDQGYWEFTGLPAADYRISFWSYSSAFGYLSSTWQGRYDEPQGDRVPLAAGQSVAGIDEEFFDRTSISVRFDCSLCGTGLPYALVVRYDIEFRAAADQPWVTVHTTSDWGESKTLNVREPGQYRVMGSFAEGAEWGYGYTEVATLAEGDQVTLPSAAMVRPSPERISGPSRFDTTAEVVKRSHPGTSSVVYIANGMTFADALSAGPSAVAEGAPLLLVTATSVPDATLRELNRLSPDDIIIVGGVSAVSTAVESRLSLIAPVTRREGRDRYATSRQVAESAFPAGSDLVYIATGQTFPDALSAGAVAGALGAPLITVNGMASRLDDATRALIISLGAKEVRVVGSALAVSAGIESGLRAVPGVEKVERFAGPDRYATSLAVSAVLIDSSSLFLAVGTSFADALGGGPYAGATGSPLVVIPRSCVPPRVLDYLRELRPDHVRLLGGTNVLGSQINSLTLCG